MLSVRENFENLQHFRASVRFTFVHYIRNQGEVPNVTRLLHADANSQYALPQLTFELHRVVIYRFQPF